MKPRVLIVSEGTHVSVYVDGDVQVQHFDRPLVRSVAANDYMEEHMPDLLGLYWQEVLESGYHRFTFCCDVRPLRERERMKWPLAYDVIREASPRERSSGGKRVATIAAVMEGP